MVKNDIEIDFVRDCVYHRNGIMGVGFYVFDFVWRDEDDEDVYARAIVFSPDSDSEKPTHYAVTVGDARQRFRGDHFIDAIWAEIKRRRDDGRYTMWGE